MHLNYGLKYFLFYRKRLSCTDRLLDKYTNSIKMTLKRPSEYMI